MQSSYLTCTDGAVSLIKALGFGSGQKVALPSDLSISLKKLNNKGLHTRAGIIGYARKEKDESHWKEM